MILLDLRLIGDDVVLQDLVLFGVDFVLKFISDSSSIEMSQEEIDEYMKEREAGPRAKLL